MEKSFSAKVSEPNDELLWADVLPKNVRELKDYWLNDLVVNIWDESDFKDVTENSYNVATQRDFKVVGDKLKKVYESLS